jgi:uncharacterized protein (TIGR02246 family)
MSMADTPTIEALLAQWIDAFNKHDLDAHMALYTEDATLFGAVDPLQIGREAVRAYFAARGPNVHVKSYHAPVVTHMGTDHATTAADVDFADGDTPMPYRVTWALVRVGGNWRIAQHHGSRRHGH